MSRCEYCGESLCGGGCAEQQLVEARELLGELERRIAAALEYIKESGDDPACNIERILKGEQ